MFRKLAGLTAIAGLFVAGTASADIANTDHNLSGLAAAGGQICIVCHAPHDTDVTVSDAPLWNHAVTGEAFTPYDSATLTATDVAQPNGNSKLCLSCHDGQTAVDAFGAGAGTNPMTGTAVVGTILTDDHPVSFQYTSALATADGGLTNPDAVNSNFAGDDTITATMLFNGSLECGTCHDPHDAASDPDGFFQRYDNANSDLCLTCHIK